MKTIHSEGRYILALMSGFFGGYLISGFPKEFLDLFSTPVYQSIVIFIMFFTIKFEFTREFKVSTLLYTIIETIVVVVALQLLHIYLHSIYSKNKDARKNKELNENQ